MTPEQAQAALGTAEQAHTAALAEATEARRIFEEKPSPKTHADMAVKEQLAHNAMTPVELAKGAVEEARRAEIGKALAGARVRANRDRLLEETAPQRARLLALFQEACAEVAIIEAAARLQREASEEATDLARELGQYSDADPPVSMDLLRAVVGVTLAQHLVESDVQVPHAHGPWRCLEPRWDRGSGAPDVELIRQARALVIPDDAFDVRASVDFHHDAADIAPWEATPDDRPKRWEI